MKKARTRIIWGIVIVIIAVIVIARVFKKEEPVVPTPDPVVTVQTPHMGDILLTTDLVGTIEPADIVYIYPKAGGDVTAVNVKAGDVVAAGQVLLEIDTKQVDTSKNSMDAAKVAWDDAQSTLARMAPLHASGFVSDKEFEGYQTAAEAKRLQYESAKIAYENQMEFGHVTSPISGRVEQLNVEVHDTVGNSNQLCVIAGDSGNNVTFYVTEKVKNHLNPGDPITVIKEGTEYGGNVIEVSNMAEASVGLFKIKASVDDNETMAAGTSVELRVPSASARNAILIPNNCVYYKSGDAYVYTYDNGIIHEVPVEVGIYDSENIAVLSGITLDDRILTTWTSELKEGTKVTLETEAPATIEMNGTETDAQIKMQVIQETDQTDKAESPAADQSQAQ